MSFFFVRQTSDLTSSVSAVYILFKKTHCTYNIIVNDVVHYYTKLNHSLFVW